MLVLVFISCNQASPRGIALAVVGMQGRTNFGGTLLKWALHRLEGNAAALRAGIGTGSAAVATVPPVEQSQLRLRMRSSGRTISSGGPRRSITSRSVFMAHVG